MLVIIGSGHAGYSLAREWRKKDTETPLTIITRDDGAGYYKPELSKAFAAGKDADGLVKADVGAMAQELDARILTHTEVLSIEPDSHEVRVEGESIPYTRLVLATGARPIRLALEGEAADSALSVNNRQDYAGFRERLRPGGRVLIMGAGLIGCEFANDLAAAGYGVSVVDVADWPLSRFVPEVSGRALQEALGGIGVQWHLGTSVQRLEHGDDGRVVATLADGQRVEADVVLSAVGLRPDVELARSAGLRCAAGILVDERMQTSAEDVYALGDCVEIGGRPLPFILPIMHAARALGATLAGDATPVRFPPMPTPVKTPVCPTVVCPPATEDGSWVVEGEAPDLEAVFVDDQGRPAGFALTGKATARRSAMVSRLAAETL